MKKEDIMDGIGEIDGKIVADAAKMREGRRGGVRKKILFSVIAAVLVFAMVGAAIGVMQINRVKEAVKGAINGAVPAEEAEEGPAGDEKKDLSDGDALYGAEKGKKTDFFYSAEMGEGIADGAPAAPAPEGAKEAEGYPAEPSAPADPESPAGVLPADGLPREDATGMEEPAVPGKDPLPGEATAFTLTAAEWRDLDNWPFFLNLVNSEKIAFPAYGLDPRRSVAVKVCAEAPDGDEQAAGIPGEKVVLLDADGAALFEAVTDKNGDARLFWGENETPATVACGEAAADVVLKGDNSGVQDKQLTALGEDVTFTKEAGEAYGGLQVAFIIDTTGSMGDELAYLQKDFASISEEVGTDGITYSVNFYRDEGDDYVTKCNPFSDDIDAVKKLLNGEYCTGGGDAPEAVADILKEVITDSDEWAEDCDKLAFLIFDASPHEGTEDTLVEAVKSAAARGIRLIPVVASGSERDTELFGRAAAILTGGTYVFLTDDSGVGNSHLEPIVGDFEVELLHDVIVRIINEHRVG